MNCRHCHNKLEHLFLDLGFAPPSNAYLEKKNLEEPEVYFPLKLFVCEICWLVQTADYAKRETFFNESYSYFSSVSESWMKHAANYCDQIIDQLGLNVSSRVVEIASNDGYLLKNFIEKDIPCLGIEPTTNTADNAIAQGVPVIKEFFGSQLAHRLVKEEKHADLVIGNNVYAHVPDINDFTAAIKTILKPSGVVTLEFPHLANLIKFIQFDTVYHEHYSYLSLYTVSRIFSKNSLKVYKVEKLNTHGGSLRVYGCHEYDSRPIEESVSRIIEEEKQEGLRDLQTYAEFQDKVDRLKNAFISFLVEKKEMNESVVAYGAAAKGNTLLNYAGVRPDLLPMVADAAPSKQNKFMPGSHIPIVHPKEIKNRNPDWVLILPWNISKEITQQLSGLKKAGTQFLVAVPELTFLS